MPMFWGIFGLVSEIWDKLRTHVIANVGKSAMKTCKFAALQAVIFDTTKTKTAQWFVL